MIGDIKNRIDIGAALKQRQDEVAKAKDSGELDAEGADDASQQLARAADEAAKDAPDGGRIATFLNRAKGLLQTAATIAGGATALVSAMDKLAGALLHL
jgi:hypothetical protein